MAIDLNNIKLTSSMTATGMYGIDMSNGNPCLSTIEHTADLYDGFTDSSICSATCIRPISVFAEYMPEENELEEMGEDEVVEFDYVVQGIARLYAVFVIPELADYDTDKIKGIIEYSMDIDTCPEVISPRDPFLVIGDLDSDVDLEHEDRMSLYLLMAITVFRFVSSISNVSKIKVYYTDAELVLALTRTPDILDKNNIQDIYEITN